MPDVSVISELCEILSVSSNELLAGEQLGNAESFCQKAEENIMELMKKNKNVSLKLKWSLSGAIAGLLLLFLYMMSIGRFNRNYLARFMDLPSFCCVTGVIVLLLVTSGRLRTFLIWIRLVFRKSFITSEDSSDVDSEMKSSLDAVNTAILASIFGGLFGTLTSAMYLLTLFTSPEQLGSVVSVALVSMFYGIIFAIVLLPIREKLMVTVQR